MLANLAPLYEATRRIGLSDSLDRLLDTVLEQAQELIGAEHCALMLYDPERRTLTVKRVRGYGERSAEVLGLTLTAGTGLSGWACERRQAVRVNDVRSDPRYVAGLPSCRSNLAVPLIVANEVAGVINVESERLNAFTEEHEALLTVLGSQAALAILAARARQRLQQRLDQLNALYRISQLASGHDELDGTLTSILQITAELVPEGQIAVLLVDEDELVVRASRGYVEGVEGMRIPMRDGITGRCARTGQMVLVEDLLEEHEDYIPGVEGACCEIALPLTVEGRVIGILNLESRTPRAYSDDHLRVLRVIAQQAAVVIRSAQLHAEAKRLAVTDPLTGLHNRRYFVEKLERHLSRANRYEEGLALLLLDADHLKTINDRHGHLVGDRALLALAEVVRRTLRESDEVARLGGDEFAALLLSSGRERARAVASRVREGVGELALESDEGSPFELTVSVGAALFPDHGIDAKSLLREADLALYRAKRQGRNGAAIADGGGPSVAPPDTRFLPPRYAPSIHLHDPDTDM